MATKDVEIVAGHLLTRCPAVAGEVSESASQEQTSKADSQIAEMQAFWDKAVCKELANPYKYQSVGVLIIRWAEHLDRQLNCGPEVQELKTLFAEKFRFTCTELILDERRKPQHQLNAGISNLVRDHDGPCRSHLLIVYYTGHGIHSNDNELEIAGVRDKSVSAILQDEYEAVANWSRAEQALVEADADVLVILDTCSAGSAMKNLKNDLRTFEVLFAAGIKTPASPPGPRSFTRALIDSLDEQVKNLDDAHFTTYDLNNEIMRRRNIQDSHVMPHRSIHSSRHIKLAPLSEVQQSESLVSAKDASSLTLRFVFREITRLSKMQIEKLAEKVSQGAYNAELGIRAIEMTDFKASKDRERFAENGERFVETVRLHLAVKKAQKLWRRPLLGGSGHHLKRTTEELDEDGQIHKRLRQDGKVLGDTSTHAAPCLGDPMSPPSSVLSNEHSPASG